MTWPIPTLPTNRTNATSQLDTHPGDHNALADAVNELYARLPRGYIGHAYGSAVSAGAARTDIPGCSVTWTAEATRRYRITGLCPTMAQVTTAGIQTFGIADASGNIVQDGISVVAAGFTAHHISILVSGVSGSQTRKLTLQTTAGTASVNANVWDRCIIVVEDIGKV